MDAVTANSPAVQYRPIIRQLLQDYAAFLGNDDQVQVELVLDEVRDRYLLVEAGWENGRRIYGTLIHIDIVDHKVWVQQDGTEEGVADELVTAGIPKERIVLGYKPIEQRKLMEFAVS